MSSAKEKGPKKLKLLPEVLPAPTLDAGAAARPSPRERTLSRLSKLMAVAATGAVLAGCGGDEKSGAPGSGTTTGASPAASGAASAEPTAASAAATASAEPTATATAAVAEAPDAGSDAGDGGPQVAATGSAKLKPAQPQPPRRDRGYQVVDMLPSPSRGGQNF